MKSGTSSRDNRDRNLVGFVIGEVNYAVPIARVQEIINPLDLVPMAYAPICVRGVADHRGRVVPVIDLRAYLRLEQGDITRRTKWIIVNVDETSAIGLIVDRVTEVFGAGDPQERRVPHVAVGSAGEPIAAAYSHEGSLVFVLDIDRMAEATSSVELASAHAAIAQTPTVADG